MSGWISVKDRLPSRKHPAVAVLLDGEIPAVAWAGYWSGASSEFYQWVFPVDDIWDSKSVTHWCALPAIPK